MKNSILLYLLLFSSFQSFSQVNLTAGLMAYYPFNGNGNDASGNGNNPVFNNAKLTADRFGNPNSAYLFNGIDNYIRIANSASLNSSNQISICAWVKVAGFYEGICHGNNIVMKGDADFQPGDYKIRFDDSYITNNQNCFNNTTDVTHETFFGINATLSSISPFIQTDQWYSLVYTNDGTTAKIYVNCQLAGEGPSNGLTFTNTDDLFLGRLNNAQYPYWFNGVMDEVRIYNRALNEDEIKEYGNCSTSNLSCSNWLKTPSTPSSVKIGQLNIAGDKVTIEASVNRTTPYFNGQVWAGDIVSKHRDPTDANYILRPNSAEITTTNGYYKTPNIADIELNKTHHIAMVYDGSTLKFYRDGCLMSQISASGSLVQNSWEASIGYYSPEIFPDENFIGYINEVRIWNIAKTQDELRTYMNTSLPNPTTQPGLLAYYTFDNLINKQGNPTFNGTLNGSASINQTNPACAAIVSPCICNLQIIKSNDTSICINSKVQLSVTGGTYYSWTPVSSLNNSTIPNPVGNPETSTKYYVTVSDDNGCSKKDSVTITVNSLPVISKSNDTTICINTKSFLVAKGGSSYTWTPVNSLDNANISNPVASPLSSTTYSVKVTDNNGCSQTAAINVNMYPASNISVSNDTLICKNTFANLFASGGKSYSWSPAASLNNSTIASPVATPSQPTLYHVNINDEYSCLYKDSIKVSIVPDAVFTVSPDSSICENNAVQLSASGGDSYVWTPALYLDNPNVSNPVATVDSSIIYSVAIKETTCNQSAVLTTRINVLPKPVVHASRSNEIDCFSSSAQLSASGANQYVWSPSSGLNNAEIANPAATPETTTVYTVTGKDFNGCANSDTVSIKVNFDRNIFFGLPNSFTPNGDGLNDCFGVSNWGTVTHLELNIYNRFGQKVFYTNNPAICWDGTFQGRQQNADVYVYTIKATMSCGKIDKKGTVTLLR